MISLYFAAIFISIIFSFFMGKTLFPLLLCLTLIMILKVIEKSSTSKKPKNKNYCVHTSDDCKECISHQGCVFKDKNIVTTDKEV